MVSLRMALERMADTTHHEAAPRIETSEFYKVINSRRAVRRFTSEKISDEAFSRIIASGINAPSSSNMQLWHFIRITSPVMLQKTARLCFDQPAATTAVEIVAVIARPSLWKDHQQRILAQIKANAGAKELEDYYGKLMPIAYAQGPLSLFGYFKFLFATTVGIFRPIPRGPFSQWDVEEVCIKSAALAAENIMLAYRAEGYDSCPMEGYDEWRLKRLLGLKLSDRVVMLIAAGKRAKDGVLSSRVRFPVAEVVRQL